MVFFLSFRQPLIRKHSLTTAEHGPATDPFRLQIRTERIRCRGTYTVDASGNNLRQNLRCASDSYKFELTSNVAAKGNNLSGSWSEASRNVNGSIEGSISGGQVNALVTANGYAATFFMSARGSRQSVKIDSKGEIRGVTISLAKGN